MSLYKGCLLASFLAIIALVVPSVVFAQTSTSTTQARALDQVTQLYVQNLKLNATSYKAGDTVQGSFSLVDDNTIDASNVYYRVAYMGNYTGHNLPQYQYFTGNIVGPIFVPATGATHETFSFTLPNIQVGTSSVGIEVQALNQAGRLYSWDDAQFTLIKGGNVPTLNVSSVFLKVGTTTFSPTTGPTIFSDETGQLVAKLYNPGNASVTVTPQISIYNRVIGTSVLLATPSLPVTVTPQHTATVTYSLPTFHNTPGVYAGTLDFTDAQNVVRSAQYQFRYIVPGAIATIQSVLLNPMNQVRANQPVQVTIVYTGAPDNILTYQSANQGQGQISTTLYDRDGTKLSQATTTGSLNGTVKKNVTLTPEQAGQGLFVKVVISKNGKVLSTYTTVSPPALASHTSSLTGLWYLLASMTILGVLIGYLWWKKKRGSAIPLAILFVVIMFTFPSVTPVHAETLSTDACTQGMVGACFDGWTYTNIVNTYGDYYPGYYLLTPDDITLYGDPLGWPMGSAGDGIVVGEGETFDVPLFVNANTCLNSAEQITGSATFNGQTNSFQSSFTAQASSTDHSTYAQTDYLNAGTYVAPTTPGTYQVKFSITNTWLNGGPNGIPVYTTVYGYLNVYVIAPASGSSITAQGECNPYDNNYPAIQVGLPGSAYAGPTLVSAGWLNYNLDVSTDNFQSPNYWWEQINTAYAVSIYPLLIEAGGYNDPNFFMPNNNQGNLYLLPGTTYYLRMDDPGVSYGTSISTTIPGNCAVPPVPVVTLTASSSSITLGSSDLLTWTSINVQSCNSAFSSSSATNGSASVTPSQTGTSTYTITCVDSSGNDVSSSASIDVVSAPPPPPPSVTLTPTSQTIILGQSASISSTVTATSPATISSCTLSSGGTSQTVTPNTLISEAPTQLGDTSYSMTCTDSNGNSATAPSTITTVLPTFSFTAPTSPVPSNTSFNLQWNFTTPSGLTMRVPHPSLWQNMLATLGLEPAPAYAATSGDTFTCDLSWSTASSGISALWKNSSGVWSSWSSAPSTQSVSVSYDGTGVGSGVWPVKLTNTGTSPASVSFMLQNCVDTNGNTLPTQQPTVTVNPLNPVISNFSFSNTCSDPNLTLDVSSQGSVSCTVTGPSFSQTYTGTPSSTFGSAISQTIPTSAQSGATYSVSCTNSGGSSGSQTATFSPTSTCTPASSSGGSTNFLQF